MHPRFSNDPHRPAPHAPGADARASAHSPHPPEEGDPPAWRGITWRDVPGHDHAMQKLNFSLLKRGLLSHHESCKTLEGEALRLKLHQLSDRNRRNSRKRRHALEQPPQKLPPGCVPPASLPQPGLPRASPWRESPSATAGPERSERSGPS